MKRIIIQSIALLLTFSGFSQIVSLLDPNNTDPTTEITILVDLTQTSNDWGIVELAAGGEDMYMWTWKPYEFTTGPKTNGTGAAAWKSSNELLKMTKVSEGIYSYTMTPTEFYEVTAKEVYDEDIHFLVKPKDGGGYGDPDRKTEDLLLEFNLPIGPSKIFYTFPNTYGPDLDSIKLAKDDVFSLLYNAPADEKVAMQNTTIAYIYPILKGSDSLEYKIAPNAKKVADYPQLLMKSKGNGQFQMSKFLGDINAMFSLPVGVEPTKLVVQVVKPNLKNSDDASDNIVTVNFNICE
jgi:hypothetical protein